MIALAFGLAVTTALLLLWYAFSEAPRPQRKYTAWRTLDLWDRARDKSSDHAPRSVREWSDR